MTEPMAGHAIITGGSSGIGLAIAELLCRRGTAVSLIARDEDKLAAAKQALTAGTNGSGRVQTLSADVRDASALRDAIATALQDSVLPDLKQHIVTSRVTTPQDFQDRLWSFKGAGFGLEPVITQSAWFRPHNRSEDIKNLFLVGAGTQPGAGVPSVLMSAKMLEQVVPHALAVY